MSGPSGFTPAYLQMDREELRSRAARGLKALSDCRLCPRDCGVNRLEDRWSACKTGRYALVSSAFPHSGEEDCLRGWNGSGTIFFSHCNLRCVFCQNFEISQGVRTAEASRRYLKAADYPDVAQAAVREMHRQVGHLLLDDRGIARRGVLIRHLVMPGLQEETRSILHWIAKELGPECYLNLMDQYRPGGRVKGDAFPELNRPLPRAEYQSAIRTAKSLGLGRLDVDVEGL